MREKKKCENCFKECYELIEVKVDDGEKFKLCEECKEQLVKVNS